MNVSISLKSVGALFYKVRTGGTGRMQALPFDHFMSSRAEGFDDELQAPGDWWVRLDCVVVPEYTKGKFLRKSNLPPWKHGELWV